jgi:hypothetical protein
VSEWERQRMIGKKNQMKTEYEMSRFDSIWTIRIFQNKKDPQTTKND